MVIRHAEKPAESGPPYGVTVNGDKDSESLIVEGWQRAGGTCVLFRPVPTAMTTDLSIFCARSKTAAIGLPSG